MKDTLKDEHMNDIQFKKSLGQNFLFDKNLLSAIVADAGVMENDVVLEIGAGAGTLTEQLAKKAKKVLSFEIDESLKPYLDRVKNENKNVEIFYEDFMKVDLEKILTKYENLKVVANIPYYITTPIIFKLIKFKEKFSSILVLIQKEVAERFSSKANSKDYGITSVDLQAIFNVSIPRVVKKECFTPMPKIDSALCKLVPHNKYEIKDYEKFCDFVSLSFSMRRKTLINNLKNNFNKTDIEKSLIELELKLAIRPEEISVEKFIKLFEKLCF